MADVPQRVVVSTGDGRDRTDGAYLLHGTTNGLPYWRKAEDRWLYSSPKGLWTITDKPDHFATGWGYVVSCRHNGELPHLVGRWKGTEGSTWKILPHMTVSVSPMSMYSVPLLTDIPSATSTAHGVAHPPTPAGKCTVQQAIAQEEAAEAARHCASDSETLYQQCLQDTRRLLDSDASVQQAIAEEEAAEAARHKAEALQRAAQQRQQQQQVPQQSPSRHPGSLPEARTTIITEQAVVSSLAAQRERIQEALDKKNHTVAVLQEALHVERSRAGAAESMRGPLVEQSEQWRQAAQELMQAKIQLEAELQDVRDLASQRIREKDRVISALEAESGKVKDVVDGLSRELSLVRHEVNETRQTEKKKEGKIRVLERRYKDVTATLQRQERLLQQRQFREAEESETRVRACMDAVEERIWGDAPSPHTQSGFLDDAAYPSVGTTTLPPCGDGDADPEFCYELDDELPSGCHAAPPPLPQRKRDTLPPAAARTVVVQREEWPPVGEDAVVQSLAQILRNSSFANRLG